MDGEPLPISLLYIGSEVAAGDLATTSSERGVRRFTIDTAANAEIGRTRLADEAFDCVLVDDELPEADGIEFLRSARAVHETRPMLYIVDAGRTDRAEAALDSGATDVVRRENGRVPHTLLANRIENAVRRHRNRGDPALNGGMLPVGVYRSVLEPHGEIVAANPTFASLFQADSVDDLVGTEAVELYRDPADRDELRERLSSDGVVRDMEVPAKTLDGDHRWVSITATRTDDGRTYADGIVRSIANRKARETELSTFRHAVEHAGHSVYFTDRNGRIEYVNRAFERTTGYTAEKAIGQTPRIVKSGEHGRTFYESLWGTILSGEVWRDEIVNTTKHGDRYVADQTIAPVEGSDGDIERFVAINIDITDRKRREQTLKRFRSAVEHAGHAVLITDTAGTIEYVNEAFEDISGYSAAEAIGRTPSILKSGAHDPEFYRQLWGTITAGEAWHGEVINQAKNGEQYVVDQTIAPITDSDGEITGYVGINRDVTELKTYERKLEEQNDRLEQYGHSVAHDLRNPLMLLNAHLDDLEDVAGEDSLDGGTVRRHCRDAREVVDRMELLIEELLTMAKQGQQVMEPESVSIEAIATEAWEQVKTSSAELQVEDTTVAADPNRLRELLSNLFRNAIEHGSTSPDSQPRQDSVEHADNDVTVRVGPLDFVEGFFVEDDGPGIPPAERERVLDRGFSTDEEGTGFGLAIVEQIATAHDWDITVTDGRDGGARFEFRSET